MPNTMQLLECCTIGMNKIPHIEIQNKGYCCLVVKWVIIHVCSKDYNQPTL